MCNVVLGGVQMGEELKQTIKKVLVDSKSISSYRGIDIKGNKAVIYFTNELARDKFEKAFNLRSNVYSAKGDKKKKDNMYVCSVG